MPGYNFTERVRKVLAMAAEESFRLKHEYVGTEHILLGLVREGEGVAAAVLRNLRIDPRDVVESLEKHVKKGIAAPPTRELPYTTRAKKILELAMAEANELGHSYVGTEHLLLGIMREERGIAGQVLTALGAELGVVRAETLRLLGGSEPGPSDPAVHAKASRGRLVGIRIQVNYEGGGWSAERFDRVEEAIDFLKSLSPPGQC